ncbi:MAG: cytochrome ubiquinol oxidase subunit I, partial [Planctomycetales bacterium]|nr:cytochrome ubiquinol oxidase subunit I [Planctomycetales bacterium]
MVFMEGMFLRTGRQVYHHMARFWTKIFALTFGIGVATGIVMEFEFGTNWAAYSRFVGDVFGSALAAEGIFAFFLESGFLAVLVFGWDRVGPKMHLFSTLMVFLGSVFSAVWIVIANSWQQTPAGYQIVWHEVQGQQLPRAEVTDFWAMIFNPSSVDRLSHTIIGALVLGAFFVASVCSYYLLKNRHHDVAKRCLSIALPSALLFSILAAATGHDAAQKLVETQPAKLAAMEAHFETTDQPTGLYLFGWPDAENETVHFGVQVPRLLSMMVYNDPGKPVPGIDQIPAEDRPPVWLPFQTFHLMVGLGTAMLGVAALACWCWFKGTYEKRPRLMWVVVLMPLAAMVANQAGWITAEVGRQPWIVYPSVQNGVEMMGLRTRDGLSESVTAQQVTSSIVLFGVIYSMLFAVWIFVLNHKIHHGPETGDELFRRKRAAGDKSLSDQISHGGTTRGGGLMDEAGG